MSALLKAPWARACSSQRKELPDGVDEEVALQLLDEVIPGKRVGLVLFAGVLGSLARGVAVLGLRGDERHHTLALPERSSGPVMHATNDEIVGVDLRVLLAHRRTPIFRPSVSATRGGTPLPDELHNRCTTRSHKTTGPRNNRGPMVEASGIEPRWAAFRKQAMMLVFQHNMARSRRFPPIR